MSQKTYYIGSMGPFPYEATETYPDGKRHKGFRGRARLEGDADDAPVNIETTVAPTSPEDGDMWILTTGAYARVNGATIGPLIDATSVVTDHGALSGLGDDDHSQYLLASGARGLSGNWNAGAFTITSSAGFAGPLNGTVGATTPAAGAFTTLSASGALTLAAGPINFTPTSQCRITHTPTDGLASTIHIEPKGGSASLNEVKFFRLTNTSSTCQIAVCKGDGTNTSTVVITASTGTINIATGGEYRVNGTKIGFTTGAIGGVLVTTPAAAHMLLYDDTDSRFENVAMSGDATIAKTGALTLANSGVSAGTYTSVTVDAKGRVTAGTNPSGRTTLSTNITPVENNGTGEDNLMTYSIPAGQLAADKSSIWFEAVFSISSANTWGVKVYFGATAIYTCTGNATDTGQLLVRGRIIRTGATTQLAYVTAHYTGSISLDTSDIASPTETLSGAITLKGTGEAVVTGEVTQTWLIVGYDATP